MNESLKNRNQKYYRNFGQVNTNDIVISGFSGRFPESSNVYEFKKNLFAGIDMVNDDPRRWPKGIYGLPTRTGKIKDVDLEYFDQQFFNIHHKQALSMDPQMRMLLETTYEAIIDAGVNPQDLRGSNTGVYIGCSSSEIEEYYCGDPERVDGYALLGCEKSMFANRISFIFDLKGSSFAIDTACSSSLYALNEAFEDIKCGRCDAAIVGGVGLNLQAITSLQFHRLGMLSADGICKTFDENADGYARADGCAVVFIQKLLNVKRMYAKILNVRTNNDGYKEMGITYPDAKMQACLMKETYNEVNISPKNVVYVEAHGTGTKVGDPQEIKAIADVFCQNRNTPLLVGSVKSNMGHSEAAAGMCSLIKVLIAMESGIIPGNLYYNNPNPELHSILNGQIKVIDRNTAWNGGLVGINSFGFGGANVHVILESNPKIKTFNKCYYDIPRMVLISGRTKDGIENRLKDIKENKNDEEYLNLINNIHYKNIPLHHYRSYYILDDINCGMPDENVVHFYNEQRPIWCIYSGLEIEWTCMDGLLKFEVCRNSIQRCAEILKPEGLNLFEILSKNTKTNIIESLLTATTLQLAFTDLLTFMDIIPRGFIGNSIGELICGYADGSLTIEQAILTAYWIGKYLINTNEKLWEMITIGLSASECEKRMPKNVFLTCLDSTNTVLISGPSEIVCRFMNEVAADGIFVDYTKASDLPMHSKHIETIFPKLLGRIETIITDSHDRSERWLSTSIPANKWTSETSQKCSATYFVNNVLSPVLFHQTIQHIPKNAVCVALAPSHQLKSILKSSLGDGITTIDLWDCENDNKIRRLLSNIGRLYMAGVHPNINKLYKTISYPVSRGTPMLSYKVDWDHSQRFIVPKIEVKEITSETFEEINLTKDEHAYLSGHIIDGSNLYPVAGYIIVAWKLFCKTKNCSFFETAIVVQDIIFYRSIALQQNESIKLGFNYLDGTGKFEICHKGLLIVSGNIFLAKNIISAMFEEDSTEIYKMDHFKDSIETNDIYNDLKNRRYDYCGKFNSIVKCDSEMLVGKIQWDNNWILFLDSMIQFHIFANKTKRLYLPNRILKIIIDPAKHLNIVQENIESSTMNIYSNKNLKMIQSGGIIMNRINLCSMPVRCSNTSPRQYVEFVPYINLQQNQLNDYNASLILIQIATENFHDEASNMKMIDFIEKRHFQESISYRIQYGIPKLLCCDVTIALNCQNHECEQYADKNGFKLVLTNEHYFIDDHFDLIIGYDSILNVPFLKSFIRKDGFIMLEENISEFDFNKAKTIFDENDLNIISMYKTFTHVYILLKQSIDIELRTKKIIFAEENNKWMDEMKRIVPLAELEKFYIYIVSQNKVILEADGLLKSVNNVKGGKYTRVVIVEDKNLDKFSFNISIYAEQLKKDLVINVYRQSCWGSYYRQLKIDELTEMVRYTYINANNSGDLSNFDDINMERCTVYCAPVLKEMESCVSKQHANIQNYNLVEFSGLNSNGQRIMALVTGRKSLATTICVVRKNQIWKIPNDWSMAEASTVPYAYTLAYYALMVRGCMCKNETILIHSGADAIGEATISVALHHQLIIYTTVDSNEKVVFLKKTFPQLNDQNIINTNSISFKNYVLNATDGNGVDIILNSLSGDYLTESIQCLGLNGRFLQIGDIDLKNNINLGMSIFLKNTSFNGIFLDNILTEDKECEIIDEIVSLVAEGIKNGTVRPLNAIVFNHTNVSEAFKLIESDKYVGKVVIKFKDEEDCNEIIS